MIVCRQRQFLEKRSVNLLIITISFQTITIVCSGVLVKNKESCNFGSKWKQCNKTKSGLSVRRENKRNQNEKNKNKKQMENKVKAKPKKMQ